MTLALAIRLMDFVQIAGIVLAVVVMIVFVRKRKEQHGRHVGELATENVCEHLRPALDSLEKSGHTAVRVGQKGPDMPMEIHVLPGFDAQALHDQLKLADPVFVSERNVIYCRDCWCEIGSAK